MSGVVLEKEEVKGVFSHSVSHPSYISMLGTYRKLLLSVYGPKGSSVLISNAVERETLISSSAEIIKELSFGHPTTKYINALMDAQNTSCGINGLYTGLVCVGLLEEALKCEEEMPHPLISCISEWIISELIGRLDKFPAEVVMELDIGEMDQVVAFIKTIIGSKSCLGLSDHDINELSINIVRAFLKSIPIGFMSDGFGHISILMQEDGPSCPGGVCEGILYRNIDLLPSKVEEAGMKEEIKLLLFTVPLSYTEDTATVNWVGDRTKEENFVSLILANLLGVLRKRNVTIIANQKYIHPVLKFELERAGYLVLERLGTNTTDALVKVSGCRGVGNLSNLPGGLNDAVLGTLTSVRNVVFNNKDYILLDHHQGCAATLLLPNTSTPNILPTLQETAKSCLSALRMAVVDGKVVCGGGCLEAWAAHTVSHLVTTNTQHITTQNPTASPHHIFKVGNIFISVLMELSLHLSGGSSNRFDWSLDTVFHHLWYTPSNSVKTNLSGCSSTSSTAERCVCGLVTQDMVRYKYNGWWKSVDYLVLNPLTAFFPSQYRKEGQVKVEKKSRCIYGSERRVCETEECEVESVGQCTEDSLEGHSNSSDDIDSLEKTSHSNLEEDMDSLEGRLESLDIEEYDSLEDILDSYPEAQDGSEEGKIPEIRLEEHKSGALYDSFAAKFNGTRLALEGFTQLLHIGHCIFDK